MELWESARERPDSLYIRQTGQQVCEPLHQYGPAVREHILLHFVASGSGAFYSRGEIHHLSEGQGFAIFPDQITTYRADITSPWHYYWVGYSGFAAESISRRVGLSRETPVFRFGDVQRMTGIMGTMRRDIANLRLGGMAALGGLYQLLALIGEEQRPLDEDAADGYCSRAMWFMAGNYSHAISVEDVADHVGLSRSQLFRVFQGAMGVGPKACLTEIRIKRAMALLSDTALTLEQVAASVGLSSGARLNALLRESIGMSAGRYRKEQAGKTNP